MTGTSLDGLDAVLVRIHGVGLAMRAEILATRSVALPRGADSPASVLRRLATGGPCDTERIVDATHWFATLHADLVEELARDAGARRPDLVCVHGQTVFHRPPLSWQLFNPWPVARRMGCPVVFDLRGADLAAGGQGAPITPLADWILFRRAEPVVVVNLGGFCNVTRLPGDSSADGVGAIEARDVCACNLILNRVAHVVFGVEYDEDGRRAAAGRVHAEAADELARELASQAGAARSLGTGDEVDSWVERWKERVGTDLARTAVEGVARTIARACAGVKTMLLAGGGAKNHALAARLAELHDGEAHTTAAAGVPVEYREAAAMAVLGALCQDRVPITLPQVTGAAGAAPVAGCWAGV